MLGFLVFENAEVRKVRTFYDIFLAFGEFLSLAVVEVLNGTVVTCYTAVNFRFLFAYGALICKKKTEVCNFRIFYGRAKLPISNPEAFRRERREIPCRRCRESEVHPECRAR